MGDHDNVPTGFNERIDVVSDQASAVAQDQTVPLFRATESSEPEFEATGVLVSLGGRRFVATAAHVVRALQQGGMHLLIPGGGGNPLLGDGRMTIGAGSRPWQRDDFDCGVIEVNNAEAEGLGPGRFLDLATCTDVSPRLRSQRFLALGFPAHTQKKDAVRAVFNVKLTRYSAPQVRQSKYREMRLDPNAHIALEFDHRRIVGNGGRGGRPQFRGMSGSGIWLLNPHEEYTSTNRPMLVGLLAGPTPRNAKVLFGPKVPVLIGLIRQMPIRGSDA